MNIEQAKSISIDMLLDKLGFQPTKTEKDENWYLSPFRAEKTASLHVNKHKNVWYDFGEGQGGNTVDFVCLHLERSGVNHSVADALRWLKNMTFNNYQQLLQKVDFIEPKQKIGFVLVEERPIRHRALVLYLQKRGLVLNDVKKHLKEVQVRNPKTGKTFAALGMKNDSRGYEIRNNILKSSVATKDITFIRGLSHKGQYIHIFEGFMDYFSAVSYQKEKQFEGDTIILHSLSNLKKAFPYIRCYGYQTLFSWTDNDEAGNKAITLIDEFVATEEGLAHVTMNRFYHPHKDVNA
ncbi:MAG: CHC2 zinc finger domain-containing protein [Sphingobacteriales bacterium JAD_PAG50586_3]|nr:MAG: CHC2 zinc finger domain-containing protein [Sphingobacteriales bacterium JAD_PAG50586_3]